MNIKSSLKLPIRHHDERKNDNPKATIIRITLVKILPSPAK